MASPHIDERLGHPLLHKLEPCVPPCVFFDWWFSQGDPWEVWGYWLFHIVVPPMGLQTPSAPWVLSLAPSLGTLCSVQWMAVSIYFCICQAVEEPLMKQLYQAPVSKHLLVSITVTEFGDCMGWIPRWGSLWMVIPSVSALHSLSNSLHGYFVPPSKKNWSAHTLVFLFLEFHVFCKLYIGYSDLLG